MKATARDSILDAAQQVAAELGAGHVTLDAVAKTAGLSKGGVLYHFPNKDSLVNGMLERLIEQNRTLMQHHAVLDEVQPYPATHSLMLTQRTFHQTLSAPAAMAILAASAEKPELLDPLRAYLQELRQAMQAEPGDLDLKLLLWAAADGLLFQQLLDISPLPPSERPRLENRLVELARELLP